jgi:hypothetical protein
MRCADWDQEVHSIVSLQNLENDGVFRIGYRSFWLVRRVELILHAFRRKELYNPSQVRQRYRGLYALSETNRFTFVLNTGRWLQVPND